MSIAQLKAEDFSPLGSALVRPEGVCFDRAGVLWASDGRGMVSRVGRDGATTIVGAKGGLPNGICADAHGRIIVADYLAPALVRVDPERGTLEVVASSAQGDACSAPNYPAVDRDGRIWCSNSTEDAASAFRIGTDDSFVPVGDGSLLVVDTDGSVAVAARDLWFANGLAFSPDWRWLYVAETTARRIVRFPVEGATAGEREHVADLPSSPDGLAFDVEGNLWVTLVVSEENGLAIIDQQGDFHWVVRDNDNVFGHPTNVAFGGADGRDLAVGRLEGDSVLTARVPAPGMPLPGGPGFAG